MRVLMTADAVGGIWTYALDLCAALATDNVEIVLAVMGPSPSMEQAREAVALDNLVLRAHSFALEWMPDPWIDVARAGEWLMELADENDVDLVHLNGYTHASLSFGLPVLAVAHSCVLSWWQAVKGVDAPASDWSRYRKAVTDGLRSADVVVTPTFAMLHDINKTYGPFSNVKVIPNGRDSKLYRSTVVKQPLVLTAGRLWDEAKNIAAIHAVAPRITWPVCIAGDEDFTNTPPICSGGSVSTDGATGRPANTTRLGRLSPEALSDWYARAAIYALPARYEPFGLSALEAALSGCALVLGDIPSLREVWSDAATFVPPDDHNALAAAIERLINNHAELRTAATAARSRAELFTVTAMANSYSKLYRRLCQSSAGENSHRRKNSARKTSQRRSTRPCEL